MSSILPATEEEFRRLCEFLYRHTGIIFNETKRYYVERRVLERMVATGAESFSAYFIHLRTDASHEIEHFINALTVNETYFYREEHQLQCLTNDLLRDRLASGGQRGPIRIWSHPCSTGEEPYSIAISLCEALQLADAWEIEILATDISRRALRCAQSATYSERSVLNVTPSQMGLYFDRTKQGFQVKQRIRRMVSFAQMNLAESPYVGKIDCIFCMNVLMYFSPARRLAALRLFYDALEPGGFFLLGHSETLSDVSLDFEPMVQGDCRIYRKPLSKAMRGNAAAAETL
jgi:chemotaxis protein methyltransferase CheR